MNRGILAALLAVLSAGLAAPATTGAQAFDPALEAKNYAKLKERTLYLTGTPAFQLRLQQQNVADAVDFPLLLANDPERNPLGNVCAQRKNECAGDVRFYDWADLGYGVKRPVLFTARSGATISGTVWATRAGPPRRPGVVITTGSVQAPETLYWGLAAALAKAGYVVLTYDVQGQGRSDTFGEDPDENEGFPSQSGQPFYDGTEDALDFLLSTAESRYVPRLSCGNANGGVGTSHDAKQQRRVAEGLNAAYNPLGSLVDPGRIGLAGHSLGAGAVSSVGQRDPRVDAVVGWDNLGTGTGAGPECPSAPATRAAKTLDASTAATFKPALGMSADYGLTQTPKTAAPDPEGKNSAFAAFRGAGVDSMQVNIRGGSHYEFSLIPGNTAPDQLGNATLRGIDAAAWYTTAWFDKYVKGDPTADTRLLTDRWRADARTGEIDPDGDPNLFSFYYRSRYDFARATGGRATCDDMRSGCSGMAPDGEPVPYGHFEFASSPDRAEQAAGAPGGSAAEAESGDANRTAARGCLARRSPIGRRGIGRVRLGMTRSRLARLAPAPRRKTRRVWRWCVKGGGGSVSAVFTRGGKVVLVATSAPAHGNRGVRPGGRSRALRRAYPGRDPLTRSIVRASGRSPQLFVVRGARVRRIAVASRRTLAHRRELTRYLRLAGALRVPRR